LSPSNVRSIKARVSVDELTENVARRGFLQSLSVRPVLANYGTETGRFEIPVGRRRFQALSLLVKQKRLNKTTPIPCIVRDAVLDILAEDDSLAENMQHVALHPLDQFRAFVALREKGQGDEEIADAFFVTPQAVKQRLKLTSVAPALLDGYAEDLITLEQLMAFTVNQDHDRQAQVWDVINSSWKKEPYQIRRMLTETAVRASDRRAVFVGVDAYQAARGSMLHNMFQGDDGGRLEDPALLDRLVTERLQAEVIAVDEVRPLIFDQTESCGQVLSSRSSVPVNSLSIGAMSVRRMSLASKPRSEMVSIQHSRGRGMIWLPRMAGTVILMEISGPSSHRVASHLGLSGG
jgi:ParB family chromosome partitioning protein